MDLPLPGLRCLALVVILLVLIYPIVNGLPVDGASPVRGPAALPIGSRAPASQGYPVTFTETGLPSGTSWSVTMNGITESSTTASISFSNPSGVYSFVVETERGFASSPQAGYISVNGSSVQQGVVFSPVSSPCAPPSITISPASVNNLTVSINGGTQPGSSGCTIININWQWGDQSTSSSFFVASHTYRANGTFWVIATTLQSDGQTASATESVTILAPSLVLPSTITFRETGLPPGTTWSVTSGGLTLSSPSDSISIDEPNGTVAYAVGTVSGYAPNPEWGYATLRGSVLDLPVHFAPIQTKCPSPSMSISPPIFYSNTTVSVIGSTVPGSSACTITTVYWQWGDGTNSSGIPPGDHTYLYNGTYWIIATTIQSDGQVASATESITVEHAPPVGNVTISVSPRNNTEVLIDGSVVSTGASPIVEPIGYGSHNIVAYNPFDVYNSTTVEVSHPQTYVNLTLEEGTGIPGSYYPWSPIGPYKLLLSPPMVPPNGTSQAYAGHLGTMAIDGQNPDIMYVGTGSSAYPTYGPYGDGGIFKTTNHGVTWAPVDYGLPLDIVTSLVMNQSNPQELVAGFWDAGIYKTTDGGGYWFKVANYTLVSGLVDVNGTLLAGTGNGFPGSEGSVIEGPEFGSFWRVVLSTSQEVSAISASHGYLYAAAGALWKSTDAGRNWTEMNSLPNGALFVAASPANPQELYVYPFAGSSTPDYSNDGGAIFSPVPALTGFGFITFDPANPEVIWAQGSYSARISFNGGATWTNGFPTPLGAPVGDIHNTYFVPTENGTIFALSDQGIFYTKNFGRTWYPDSGDLYNFLVYGFGVGNGGSQIIASMQDYGGPQTHDGGLTWSFGNLSAPAGAASEAKVSPAGIGEGSIPFTNPGNSSWSYAFDPGSQTLIVSRDSGLVFYPALELLNVTYRGNPPMFDSLFAVAPSNTSRVYLGTSLGVFNGTSYGATWDLWPGSPSNVSAVWTSPSGTIFVSWGDSHLSYYSGGAWHQSEGVDFTVASMSFDPAQPSHVLIASNQEPSGSIYVSINSGMSFSLLNPSPIQFAYSPPPQEGYGAAPFQLFYLNTSGDPLLGITDEGVYLSQDGGTEWTNIDYNLQSGQVTWAAYANQTLFLSTFGEGIVQWKDFAVSRLPGTIVGNVSGVTGLNVTVDGFPQPTFSGHFEDYLPPGNYTVILRWIGGSRAYSISLSPSSVYQINFSPCPGLECMVSFSESGLPSGTMWAVTLGGITRASSVSPVTFEEPNGTYNYAIANVSGWHQSTLAYSGTIVVDGSVVVEPTLQFEQMTYSVTFTESGLPSGTLWSVDFAGAVANSVNTTLTFSEPNGTAAFVVGTETGYAETPQDGYLSVRGEGVGVSIIFSAISSAYGPPTISLAQPVVNGFAVTINGEACPSSGCGAGPPTINEITWQWGDGTNSTSFFPATHLYGVPGIYWVIATTHQSDGQTASAMTMVRLGYTVQFSEAGLSSGTSWSVTLNGATESSTGTSIAFSEANGTYAFSVRGVAGYTVSPSSGTVIVNGTGVTESIAFSPSVIATYTVTFTESGLPAGTSWSVTVNGTTHSSTSNTITFSEPNGTYPYSIADVPGWHQTTLPYSGSVTVDGASVSEPALVFTEETYAVTFTESSLPGGAAWSVTLGGTTRSASAPASIGFSEPNGTYSFTVGTVAGYTSSPSSGSVTVSGAAVTEAITFRASVIATYPVTFTQTGLPAGTNWSVTVNGTTHSSTSNTITFSESNGTYGYEIADVSGWHQTTLPYSGSVTVDGASVSEPTLDFTQVTYAVTFTESGLLSGTSWQVWLNSTDGGSNYHASGTTGSLEMPAVNGSYMYAVGNVPGWHITTGSYTGSLTVNGGPQSESVTFSAFMYAVTFTETGLPPGTNWSATLGGTTLFSTAGSIVFTEANGTYTFSIATAAHYTASPPSGALTVSGSPATEGITFSPSGASRNSGGSLPPLLGLPGVTGYYALGGVFAAVAVAVAGAILARRSRKARRAN